MRAGTMILRALIVSRPFHCFDAVSASLSCFEQFLISRHCLSYCPFVQLFHFDHFYPVCLFAFPTLTPIRFFTPYITISSPRALALSDYGDATDDDDTTWKVRRAAVKVVAAVIVTAKPEALKEHFESVRIKRDMQCLYEI
jgi:hypothetical protein